MKLIAKKLIDAPLDKAGCELFDFLVKEFENMVWFKNNPHTMLQMATELSNAFVSDIEKSAYAPVKKFVKKKLEDHIIPLHPADIVECEGRLFVVLNIDRFKRKIIVSTLEKPNDYWGTFDLADYNLVDVE